MLKKYAKLFVAEYYQQVALKFLTYYPNNINNNLHNH